MLIRQSLNFAIHLVAGVAFGALVVVAARAMCRGRDAGETFIGPKEPPAPSPAAAAPGN